MERLKEIILRDNTRAGRFFDMFIQVLIVISIITFTLETLPGLDEKFYTLLRWTETVIVLIFTMEYSLRVFLSEKRLSYVFSFFGIIDLLAILPFYLSTGVNLQTLRVLRLMRLFRLLKLARYSQALARMGKAISVAKEELILFTLITLILLYLSAVGIYHFEHEAQPENFRSIIDSLWWAVATLTTVGYGDLYPITTGGRLFTFLILMLGLGVVAVPTGIIASALSSIRRQDK